MTPLFTGNLAELPKTAFTSNQNLRLFVFNPRTNQFDTPMTDIELMWTTHNKFYKGLRNVSTIYCTANSLTYLVYPDSYCFLLNGALPSELL